MTAKNELAAKPDGLILNGVWAFTHTGGHHIWRDNNRLDYLVDLVGKEMRKTNPGFTLVESLVVIAMIALLVAVVRMLAESS